MSRAGIEPDRFPAGKRHAFDRHECVQIQFVQFEQLELEFEPEQLERSQLVERPQLVKRPQQRKRSEPVGFVVGRHRPDLRRDGVQRERRSEESAQSSGDDRRHGIADDVERIEPGKPVQQLIEPVQLVELFFVSRCGGSVGVQSADERAEPAENHGQEHREDLGHLLRRLGDRGVECRFTVWVRRHSASF